MPVKTPKRTSTLYATIKNAREKRAKAADDARKLVLKIDGEKRDMSAEEKEQFDKIAADVAEMDKRVTQLESIDDDADDTDDDDMDDDVNTDDDDNERSRKNERISDAEFERRIEAFHKKNGRTFDNSQFNRRSNAGNNPSRGGSNTDTRVRRRPGESVREFGMRERRSSAKYAEDCLQYMLWGKSALMNARAVQADEDVLGGYLVLPEQLTNKILKKVDNILILQQLAEVISVPNAQSLGIPTLENDPDDADWTTEIRSITQDTAMSFGKRALTPFPIRKRLLVSEVFLRKAMQMTFTSNDESSGAGGSPENNIINRLAYKIAVPREKAFFTGSGQGRPLGMFTASSRGISTTRDVNTGSATDLTYAGLVNIKMSLKVQYQKTAQWFVHRDFISKALKLVDTAGRPLLNFQTFPDQPTMLMECPVQQSEYAPNTFTNGSYVGILGDPKYYYIANSQEVTVKKAEELYAETGQIGFFISAETDGMPVLEEAFTRAKCAV